MVSKKDKNIYIPAEIESETKSTSSSTRPADPKLLATILLVLLAVAASYLLLFRSTPAFSPDGTPVRSEIFLAHLANASHVAIVMDIRNADDSVQRNILQCGVDFAGSEGLVGKNISTYAWSADRCVSTTNPQRSVSECIQELRGVPVLYVHSGNQSTFYESALIVGIDQTYTLYQCRIRMA